MKLFDKIKEKVQKWFVELLGNVLPQIMGDTAVISEIVDGVQETVSGHHDESMQSQQNSDGIEYSSLNWCWGGFNGKNAACENEAEISGLSVKSSGMNYKWVSGGCEKLGASSKEDASCTLACLFVNCGGTWKGGKFDWISTSRVTRDFKNIQSGYNGWDYSAFKSAKEFAFVIVSKDGKKRTNVVTQK